jgi:hypothetical protein
MASAADIAEPEIEAPELPEAPPPAARPAAGGGSHEPVDLGGRQEILPAAPLPDLESPGGPAFSCRNLRDRKTGQQYAIVCTQPVPVRVDALSMVRGLEHPALVRLVDWGTVYWPPDRCHRFVLVFDRPAGGRVPDPTTEPREPQSDDFLLRNVLQPMASALKDLQSRGLTCGGIRPDNLFSRDAATAALALGDFVSVPVGYGQPVLYETIERGLASPAGRGAGTVQDDLYALGVTMLVLLLGRHGLQGANEEAILNAKMERGTFMALTEGVRISNQLVEAARGLTADDPRQRWTLQDLTLWLTGRRYTPKQSSVTKRSARPLEFQGQDLWTARGAAHALSRNPIAGARLIEQGELDRWVRRSLSDEARATALQHAMETVGAGSRVGTQEDRMVARVSIALDPTAPIRYRGAAVLPDGIGAALAHAMLSGAAPQALGEIVNAQLPLFWVNCQPDFRPDHVPLAQRFDGVRTLLEQASPGYGIERILYDLNPAMPCISPLVKDRYPLNLTDMMAALEATATAGATRGREPVDRHIAGFIAARASRLNDRLFGPLAAEADAGRRIVAMLNLLTEMQRRHGPANLPGLAQWFVRLMTPAFNRFHHRPTRDKIAEEAQRVAKAGMLEPLLKLVDDPALVQKDEYGFAKARSRYDGLTREIESLQRKVDNSGQIAASTGRQVAAITSSVVAMLILVAIVVIMAGFKL